jgi:hypothetical protein
MGINDVPSPLSGGFFPFFESGSLLHILPVPVNGLALGSATLTPLLSNNGLEK